MLVLMFAGAAALNHNAGSALHQQAAAARTADGDGFGWGFVDTLLGNTDTEAEEQAKADRQAAADALTFEKGLTVADLWNAAIGGYSFVTGALLNGYGTRTPATWEVVKKCEPKTGATSQILCKNMPDGQQAIVLSFAGTDPHELADWASDLNKQLISVTAHDGTTVELHKGFHDYAASFVSCVNEEVLELKNHNKSFDYLVGHSLGGAAATIYSLLEGVPTKDFNEDVVPVVTFGAPPTRSGGPKCTVPGVRYAHNNDCVASGAAFADWMTEFEHDVQQGVKFMSEASLSFDDTDTCTGRSFLNVCKTFTHEGELLDACEEKSDEVGAAHCAASFALWHGFYGSYLGMEPTAKIPITERDSCAAELQELLGLDVTGPTMQQALNDGALLQSGQRAPAELHRVAVAPDGAAEQLEDAAEQLRR